MSIAQSLLPEFDHEFATLRKTFERVPDGKWDYAPHAKSMSLARLTGHLAELAGWINSTLEADELDFGTMAYTPFVPLATAERPVLAATSDPTMMQPWTLRQGTKMFFTMPKVAVLRSFVMDHDGPYDSPPRATLVSTCA